MTVLSSDFRDMLSALSAAGAEFLVVGGYALAAHGLPRATKDLDLWIGCSGDNPAKVYRALGAFGAPLDQLSVKDLESPNTVFQIGVPPLRIDLLTSISGVPFQTAWANREVLSLQGLDVPVLSRQDLIANKRASGRPQDLLDADRLAQLTPP